ncbi:unnamed protein product [Rotaria sordida]|uniref:Uncharacterized protein n=1 Tax=Rotaria sordida TaxID=392033 RepID=A0A818PGC1_9BILA|nr:unnamed protein product [Rotaria sordida]
MLSFRHSSDVLPLVSYTPLQISSSTTSESTIFEQVYGGHRRRPAMISLNVQWVPVSDRSGTYQWSGNDVNNRKVKTVTFFGTGEMRGQKQSQAITPPRSDYTDAYLSAFAPKPISTKHVHRLSTAVFANAAPIPLKPITPSLSTNDSMKTSHTRFININNIQPSKPFDKPTPSSSSQSSTYSSSFISDRSTKYEPFSSTQYSSPQSQTFASSYSTLIHTPMSTVTTTPSPSVDNQRSYATVQPHFQPLLSTLPIVSQSKTSYGNIYKPIPAYSYESYPPSNTYTTSLSSSSTQSTYKPQVPFQSVPLPSSYNINQSNIREPLFQSTTKMETQIDRPETFVVQHDEDSRSSRIEKPLPIINPPPQSPITREELKIEPERLHMEELTEISSEPIRTLENTLDKYDSLINQISEVLASVSPLSSKVSSMTAGKSVHDYQTSSDSSSVLPITRTQIQPSESSTTTMVTMSTTDQPKPSHLIRRDSYDKIVTVIKDIDKEIFSSDTPLSSATIKEEKEEAKPSLVHEQQLSPIVEKEDKEAKIASTEEQQVSSVLTEQKEDQAKALSTDEQQTSSVTQEEKQYAKILLVDEQQALPIIEQQDKETKISSTEEQQVSSISTEQKKDEVKTLSTEEQHAPSVTEEEKREETKTISTDDHQIPSAIQEEKQEANVSLVDEQQISAITEKEDQEIKAASTEEHQAPSLTAEEKLEETKTLSVDEHQILSTIQEEKEETKPLSVDEQQVLPINEERDEETKTVSTEERQVSSISTEQKEDETKALSTDEQQAPTVTKETKTLSIDEQQNLLTTQEEKPETKASLVHEQQALPIIEQREEEKQVTSTEEQQVSSVLTEQKEEEAKTLSTDEQQAPSVTEQEKGEETKTVSVDEHITPSITADEKIEETKTSSVDDHQVPSTTQEEKEEGKTLLVGEQQVSLVTEKEDEERKTASTEEYQVPSISTEWKEDEAKVLSTEQQQVPSVTEEEKQEETKILSTDEQQIQAITEEEKKKEPTTISVDEHPSTALIEEKAEEPKVSTSEEHQFPSVSVENRVETVTTSTTEKEKEEPSTQLSDEHQIQWPVQEETKVPISTEQEAPIISNELQAMSVAPSSDIAVSEIAQSSQQIVLQENIAHDVFAETETSKTITDLESTKRPGKRVTWDETVVDNEDAENSSLESVTEETSTTETSITTKPEEDSTAATIDNEYVIIPKSEISVDQQIIPSDVIKSQITSDVNFSDLQIISTEQQVSTSTYSDDQTSLQAATSEQIHPIDIPEKQIISFDSTERQTESFGPLEPSSTFSESTDKEITSSDLTKLSLGINEQQIRPTSPLDSQSVSLTDSSKEDTLTVDEISTTTSDIISSEDVSKHEEELESTKTEPKEEMTIDLHKIETSSQIAENIPRESETSTIESTTISLQPTIISPIDTLSDIIANRYISSDVYHGCLGEQKQFLQDISDIDKDYTSKSLLTSLRETITTPTEIIQNEVPMSLSSIDTHIQEEQGVQQEKLESQLLEGSVSVDTIHDQTIADLTKPHDTVVTDSSVSTVLDTTSATTEQVTEQKEKQETISPESTPSEIPESTSAVQKTEETTTIERVEFTPVTQHDEQISISSPVTREQRDISDKQEMILTEPPSTDISPILSVDQKTEELPAIEDHIIENLTSTSVTQHDESTPISTIIPSEQIHIDDKQEAIHPGIPEIKPIDQLTEEIRLTEEKTSASSSSLTKIDHDEQVPLSTSTPSEQLDVITKQEIVEPEITTSEKSSVITTEQIPDANVPTETKTTFEVLRDVITHPIATITEKIQSVISTSPSEQTEQAPSDATQPSTSTSEEVETLKEQQVIETENLSTIEQKDEAITVESTDTKTTFENIRDIITHPIATITEKIQSVISTSPSEETTSDTTKPSTSILEEVETLKEQQVIETENLPAIEQKVESTETKTTLENIRDIITHPIATITETIQSVVSTSTSVQTEQAPSDAIQPSTSTSEEVETLKEQQVIETENLPIIEQKLESTETKTTLENIRDIITHPIATITEKIQSVVSTSTSEQTEQALSDATQLSTSASEEVETLKEQQVIETENLPIIEQKLESTETKTTLENIRDIITHPIATITEKIQSVISTSPSEETTSDTTKPSTSTSEEVETLKEQQVIETETLPTTEQKVETTETKTTLENIRDIITHPIATITEKIQNVITSSTTEEVTISEQQPSTIPIDQSKSEDIRSTTTESNIDMTQNIVPNTIDQTSLHQEKEQILTNQSLESYLQDQIPGQPDITSTTISSQISDNEKPIQKIEYEYERTINEGVQDLASLKTDASTIDETTSETYDLLTNIVHNLIRDIINTVIYRLNQISIDNEQFDKEMFSSDSSLTSSITVINVEDKSEISQSTINQETIKNEEDIIDNKMLTSDITWANLLGEKPSDDDKMNQSFEQIKELLEEIVQSSDGITVEIVDQKTTITLPNQTQLSPTIENTIHQTTIIPQTDDIIQRSSHDIGSDSILPITEIENVSSKLSTEFRESSPTNIEDDSLELIHALQGHSMILPASELVQIQTTQLPISTSFIEKVDTQTSQGPEKSSSSTTSSQVTSSDRYVSYAIHEMGDSSQERLPAFPVAADIPIYELVKTPPDENKEQQKLSEPIVNINQNITKDDDLTELDATENLNYSDDVLLQKLYTSAPNRQENLDASSTDEDVDDENFSEFEQHDISNLHRIVNEVIQHNDNLSQEYGPTFQRYDVSSNSSTSTKLQSDDVYIIPGYAGLWKPSPDVNDSRHSPLTHDEDDKQQSAITTVKTRTIVRTTDPTKLQSFLQQQQQQQHQDKITQDISLRSDTYDIFNRPLNEFPFDVSESDSFKTCASTINSSSISKQQKQSDLHNLPIIEQKEPRTSPDEKIILIRERERGVSLPVTMKIDYDDMALRLSSSTPIDAKLYSTTQTDLPPPPPTPPSSTTFSELAETATSSSRASTQSLSSNESEKQKIPSPSWLNTTNTTITTIEGPDGRK